MIRIPLSAAVLAAAVLALPVAASAQQHQDYFIPNQARPPAARPGPAARPVPGVQARPPVQVEPQPLGANAEQIAQPPQGQLQLPPAPDLPTLQRGASPPAAVLGVIGVPDIMRIATAAQQVEKTIGERREKLNEDAQKEQNVWREMQQQLANERAKLSPEQLRTKERELQDRVTKAQRDFRERGSIIQAAAQYGLAQIERTLVGVIQKVAESRGMNLVLHRQQVALNVNEFDITEQVAEVLNKVLPSVVIPPDGVMPPMAKAETSKGTGGQAPAPAAAAAPAHPATPQKK